MPGAARGAAAKAAANTRSRSLKSVPAPAAEAEEKKSEEPAKASPAKKAAPAKAAPAARPEGTTSAVTPVEAAKMTPAQKAAATREAAQSAGGEQKCQGQCGLVKPITSFPTTGLRSDGTMGRGKICRACRDEGRKAAKAAPAKTTGK